jgi:hypothetical protein
MKKILRLVTTSVLTLTLVACGEASSSVSSSVNTGTSSVPNVSSAYANVTSVTLSAATATLTQVLGAQRRVTVTAALNANTNPSLALEWFVNGVKQTQTSRTFDFTPTEVGTFAITARVGNLSSNTLNVTLALPVLAVESAAFSDAETIKIKAPGGANVTLVGAVMLETSKYDLLTGEYVLDLEDAVVPGTTVTVRLERAGNQTLNQAIVYDPRTVSIGDFEINTGDLLPGNGVYTIVRPFDEKDLTYTININHENVLSTVATPLLIETTVPTGATAIPSVSELKTGSNVEAVSKVFNYDEETALGLYTHKITFGGKVLEVKVNMVEAKPEIVLAEYPQDQNLDFVNEKYQFVFNGKGVTAGADGVFEITKPFETMSTASLATLDMQFVFIARNFEDLESGIQNTSTISLTGPNGFGQGLLTGMATNSGTTQHADLFSFTAFQSGTTALSTNVALSQSFFTHGTYTTADTSTAHLIRQKVEKDTLAGDYTFTITAGVSGAEVTREVKVRVIEPKAAINFVMTQYESQTTNLTRLQTIDSSTTDTFVIEKPAIAGITNKLGILGMLSNYQSFLATSEQVTADSLVVLNKDKSLFGDLAAGSGAAQFGSFADIKIGSGGDAAGTTQSTDIAANTFRRFVNLSLDVNGPSNALFTEFDLKAAVLLGADKDTLILMNRTNIDQPMASLITAPILIQPLIVAGSDLQDSLTDAFFTALTKGTATTLTLALTAAGVASGDLVEALEEYLALVSALDTIYGGTATVVTDNQAGVDAIASVKTRYSNLRTSFFDYFALIENGADIDAAFDAVLPATSATAVSIDEEAIFTAAYIKLVTALDALVAADLSTAAVDDSTGGGKINEVKREFGKYQHSQSTQAFTTTKLDDSYDADEVEAAVAGNQGLFGDVLSISVTTVPGTYTLKLSADNVSKTINLVIKEAAPKLMVLSGLDSTKQKDFVGLANEGSIALTNGFITERARLFVDHATGTDQFITAVAGTYTVFKRNNVALDFHANIGVLDLPIGTYSYSITKKNPSGQVEQYSDSVTVASVDAHGVPTFTDLGGRFTPNWEISQTTAALGKYEYTFTIAGVTKSYVVDVQKNRQLEIDAVKVSGKEIVKFNNEYLVLVPTVAVDEAVLTIDVSKVNLTDANFVKVTGPTAAGSGLVAGAVAPVATTPKEGPSGDVNYISLKGLTSLNLGTYDLATSAGAGTAKLTYTLTFFSKARSAVGDVYSYTAIGETVTVVIRADN